MCFGSLYFTRVRVDKGVYCNRLVQEQGNPLPGGGILAYAWMRHANGVLDITDILKYFSCRH